MPDYGLQPAPLRTANFHPSTSMNRAWFFQFISFVIRGLADIPTMSRCTLLHDLSRSVTIYHSRNDGWSKPRKMRKEKWCGSGSYVDCVPDRTTINNRVQILLTYQLYVPINFGKEMNQNNQDMKIYIENANIKKNEKVNFEVKILFYDISNFSQLSQLLMCSTGVFVFYLLYGYMQVSICAVLLNSLK